MLSNSSFMFMESLFSRLSFPPRIGILKILVSLLLKRAHQESLPAADSQDRGQGELDCSYQISNSYLTLSVL